MWGYTRRKFCDNTKSVHIVTTFTNHLVVPGAISRASEIFLKFLAIQRSGPLVRGYYWTGCHSAQRLSSGARRKCRRHVAAYESRWQSPAQPFPLELCVQQIGGGILLHGSSLEIPHHRERARWAATLAEAEIAVAKAKTQQALAEHACANLDGQLRDSPALREDLVQQRDRLQAVVDRQTGEFEASGRQVHPPHRVGTGSPTRCSPTRLGAPQSWSTEAFSTPGKPG